MTDLFYGVPVQDATAEVTIKKLFYEAVKNQSKDYVKTSKQYRVYSAEFGAGNQTIYLKTEPNKTLQTRNQKLLLKPYAEQEAALHLGRGEYAFPKELNKAMETSHLIYEVLPAVKKQDLQKLDNNELNKIIDDHLTEGFDKDPRLVNLFKQDFFVADPKTIEPSDYALFSPHKILITNTKAGKSKTAEKVGERRDAAKISRLIGYADSQRIHKGSLDGIVEPYAFDEVQQEKDEDLWGKLFNFMETGTAISDKGCATVECYGYSALSFLGNKGRGDKPELQLLALLNPITWNTEALGSRIACFEFAQDYATVQPTTKIDPLTRTKLALVYQSLREACSTPYSEIILDKEINNWLWTPLKNEKYKDNVETYANAAENEGAHPVAQLVKSSLDAYKHIKGAALHRALFEQLPELLKNALRSEEQLIRNAEDELKFILEQNSQAFEAAVTQTTGFYERQQVAEFNDLPTHLKILIEALFAYDDAQLLKQDAGIPGDDLHNYLTATPTIQNLAERGFKRSTEDIWKRSMSSTSKGKLQAFGLKIYHIQERPWLQIDSLKTIKKLKEKTREDSG